jgi:prophage DNA circulation protein
MGTNYIKTLRKASFRGVSFLLVSDQKSSSRRIAVHEYPGRDTPYHEDLGAAPKEFTVEAVVGGEGFASSAREFEKTLDQAGAGTLIHPHYGALQVVVMGHQRSHSSEAVGEVGFSITFQKYGPPLYPSAARDTVSGLASAADSLFSSIQGDFKNRFTVAEMPDFIVSDAVSRVQSLSSGLTDLMSQSGLIAAARDFLPKSWNVGLDLAGQVFALFDGFSSATKPAPKPVVGGSKITAVVVPARSALDVLGRAIDLKASGSEVSVKSRRIKNAVAIDLLFRASALAGAAAASRHATYESREDALGIRTSLATSIETLRDDLGAEGYDRSWRDSGLVLSALNRDINERIGRLPRTVRVQTGSPRSSLAIANRLYGDDTDLIIARAADIARRNKVRHPGFVPAAPLEVLLNVQ